MFWRKRLHVTIGVLCAALAILLGGAGAANAQAPQPPEAEPLHDCPSCDFDHVLWGGWGWRIRRHSLLDATAEVTGLTLAEIRALLRDGQTFVQIADSQGVEPQAIVDAYMAPREAALEEAVARGRLSQERADRILETLTEHVSEVLERPCTPRPIGRGPVRRGAFRRGVRVGFRMASHSS